MKHLILFVILLFSSFCRGQDLDAYMAGRKLVDVTSMDTTLRVQLVYASPDNFLGKAVYSGITRAWLHPDAAHKLLAAHLLLSIPDGVS
jgi:D-alanyl-D-alanine dipeptidase